MDSFFQQLLHRASSIDEILSNDFDVAPGQKSDSDLAGLRLASWCRSSASGDWTLFRQRLERDGLSLDQVLPRFATIRRAPEAQSPQWFADALWIYEGLLAGSPDLAICSSRDGHEPQAFEHLLVPLLLRCEERLWSDRRNVSADNLTSDARASLRHQLMARLSELCQGALFERFTVATKAAAKRKSSTETPLLDAAQSTEQYRAFILEMRETGIRRLFDEKPVLLRLVASTVRQWIDATTELVGRLNADLADIQRVLLGSTIPIKVVKFEGGLSDPHNFGRSVQVVVFNDGSRVVYKPKDLRLDAVWHATVERLNLSDPPVQLRAVSVLPGNGYGWAEFIDYTECDDRSGFDLFFRRAGAWLSVFHILAGTDMHHENMIALGDHPVPIDLEMILQSYTSENESEYPEREAFDFAARKISESVMMTGLLPIYGRSPENKVYGLSGLMGQPPSPKVWGWENLNTDAMRRSQVEQTPNSSKNIPSFRGEPAKFGNHIEALIEGFETYTNFLLRQRQALGADWIYCGFAGLPVRKIIRPTRFYYLLLHRLRDHRSMNDGVSWSAQADFLARLADWNKDVDPFWPLQAVERSALLDLNIPYFFAPSDQNKISSLAGMAIDTIGTTGVERARARLERMDREEITWQSEVVRQSTSSLSESAWPEGLPSPLSVFELGEATKKHSAESLISEAGVIARHISDLAIRRGPGAAWLGLDWLGDSNASQLVPLGADLYNGAPGISVFLAAYARQSGDSHARDLALAGVAGLRRDLRSRSAARMARTLGVGAASGLGSVIYALMLIAEFTDIDAILDDAQTAARLFSDDLIAADKALDIVSGSAGAILSLLRLHRIVQSSDALERAVKCGDHLLSRRRVGSEGKRSWAPQDSGSSALNGMSHGAAGFAYALSALAAESGFQRFAAAARECIVFENSNYSAEQGNWPDFRADAEKKASPWPCQWCHGAAGIGLARAGMLKLGLHNAEELRSDITNALIGVERNWPNQIDTMCCGTLGVVEFLDEAGTVLGMSELHDLATRRLLSVASAAGSSGDYRFGGGSRRFRLGLFKGVAGVGYTLLRRVDRSLPNVLIWE